MVQNNAMGRIARKYFIAIENAYKNRNDWNFDRADTLIGSKKLKQSSNVHRMNERKDLKNYRTKTRTTAQLLYDTRRRFFRTLPRLY